MRLAGYPGSDHEQEAHEYRSDSGQENLLPASTTETISEPSALLEPLSRTTETGRHPSWGNLPSKSRCMRSSRFPTVSSSHGPLAEVRRVGFELQELRTDPCAFYDGRLRVQVDQGHLRFHDGCDGGVVKCAQSLSRQVFTQGLMQSEKMTETCFVLMVPAPQDGASSDPAKVQPPGARLNIKRPPANMNSMPVIDWMVLQTAGRRNQSVVRSTVRTTPP